MTKDTINKLIEGNTTDELKLSLYDDFKDMYIIEVHNKARNVITVDKKMNFENADEHIKEALKNFKEEK